MRIPSVFGSSFILAALLTVASGCGRTADPASATAASSPAAPAPLGTITASPNPIQVCDGSGLGVTHLAWQGPAGRAVEVRLNKPDGTLFARTGSLGEADTGKWVVNGTVFYLVDPSSGAAQPVMATVKVGVTKAGCQ